MDIKIIIAAHKECPLPGDSLYLPVHAGAAVHPYTLPYIGDHTGDHISEKNPHYCELTALYWAWKNLKADYIGLCHYRRYFCGKPFGSKQERILTLAEAEQLLSRADILVPRRRNYWIETNYSHYVHAHHAQDLELTRQILQEQTGHGASMSYLEAYDRLMKRTDGHRFNMMVMRADLLDQYCTWLFNILFELERRLDLSEYDQYNQRVFGFVSERLLDVWLMANGYPYKEIPYVFTEQENWPRKIRLFLKRKFFPADKDRKSQG